MNDFFYRYSKCRRKTIDLIFKVLKPEVKNAFISVIEWPRIPAWYLKHFFNIVLRYSKCTRFIKFFSIVESDTNSFRNIWI